MVVTADNNKKVHFMGSESLIEMRTKKKKREEAGSREENIALSILDM